MAMLDMLEQWDDVWSCVCWKIWDKSVDTVDILLQLKHYYGHVRYADNWENGVFMLEILVQCMIMLCLVVQLRQRYGHVRRVDREEAIVLGMPVEYDDVVILLCLLVKLK
jgi:hypothetical protein